MTSEHVFKNQARDKVFFSRSKIKITIFTPRFVFTEFLILNTAIDLITFVSTFALLYGAIRGRAVCLLPYFWLRLLDFCLSV